MRYVLLAAVFAAWVVAAASPAAAKTPAIKSCGSTITASGSYVLSRNLVGRPGNTGGCINVSASHVTIDLAGYNIDCQSNGQHGIAVAAGKSDVTIRNGTISQCDEGISADGATGLWLEGVLTLDNNSHGIRVGANSTVVRCLSYGNVGYGIMAQCPSNVQSSVAVANYNPFYLNGVGCYTESITP